MIFDLTSTTTTLITCILLFVQGVIGQQHETGTTTLPNKIDSNWTLQNEFRGYDEATVIVLGQQQYDTAYSTAEQSLGNEITVNVTAFNRTFTLELTINNFLIHPSYVEKEVGQLGETENQGNASTTIKDCYYIGKVSNEPNSAAAASTCGGLSAQILTNNDLFHIVPLDNTLYGRHRAYRDSDSNLPTHNCGQNDIFSTASQFRHRKKRASLNWPQDNAGVTKIVELYVVNDFSQYTKQGDQVTSRAKELYNFVSALYQPLNIYVTLVGMETWTASSQITVIQTNSTQTLSNFASYRQSVITQRNDNAQFLTSFGYSSQVVGQAYLNGMCSSQLSAAVVSDVSSTSGYTAAIAAHEMGHNFGMLHDNQIPGGCSCVTGTGKCIMNSFANNPPATQWSQCSASTMASFLSSINSYCLSDFNNAVFDPTPVCGNGIVEGTEQCDCGNAPITECNPVCCNNCLLVSPASCAHGLCCNVATCQLKPITTECRAALGSCDVAEYCSGVTNTCPSNVYVHDGTTCTVAGASSYCYSGSCRTQTTQCQLWWGPSITSSADQCYSHYNVEGTVYGNCNINVTDAGGINIPCAESDVKCGLLHCDVVFTDYNQLKLNYPRFSYVPIYIETLSTGSSTISCTAGNAFTGDATWPDPGYVPDGAVCDTNKMCVNRKCVAASDVINTVPCPNCNQQGVCNSLGECHCNVGFAPPNCSLPGYGGSSHSNPIKGPWNITTPVLPVNMTTNNSSSSPGGLSVSTIAAIAGTLGGAAVVAVVVTIAVVVSGVASNSASAAAAAAAALPAAVGMAKPHFDQYGTSPFDERSTQLNYGCHSSFHQI